jgi:hypothetical protein
VAQEAVPGESRQIASEPQVTHEALDPQDNSRTDP